MAWIGQALRSAANPPGGSLVDVAAFGDGDDGYDDGGVVDRVDDAQVAEAVATGARKFPLERFDVVAPGEGLSLMTKV